MTDPVTSAAASPLATYADALFTAGGAASAHAPLLLRVADRHVALHFDGPATTGALLPAWRSLLGDGGASADAELFIRTQSQCGRPPSLSGTRAPQFGSGRVVSLSADGVELELRADAATLALWDGAGQRGIWWGRSAEAITTTERVLPLGPLLRWALRSMGLPVLRVGAIASQRGGLLVATPRGGGCSSTVLSARRLGLAAIADEAVAIEPSTLTAHPVTGFAMADDSALRRMPELVARLAQLPRTADGKQALLLDERPLRTPGGTPLRAVVLPRRGEPTGYPQRLDPCDAERAIAEVTATDPALGHLPDAPWPEKIRALPTYVVGIDGTPDAVAADLAEILRGLD